MPDADRKSSKSPSPSSAKAPPHADAVELVFAALREHGSLPSLGNTLGRLTQMLEKDTDAVHDLANVVLSDVSLTQRLLHVANTLPYRAGTPPVTTITRAIMLLGFNQIRAAAVSIVLLEGLAGAARAAVREDFHHALLAGCLARELLLGAHGDEAEEASIAAMFRSVGRVLVASFAPDAYASVRALEAGERLSESAAARRVMGKSFDELTQRVMALWCVPERIAAATAPVPPRIDAPAGSADRVRAAAQFSDDVAGALCYANQASAPGFDATVTALLARYAPAFALGRSQLTTLLDRALARTQDLEKSCGVAPIEHPAVHVLQSLPQEAQLEPEAVQPSVERDAVGRPSNARDVLLAGLAEATDALARAADGAMDVNAIIRIVLEAMYTGLGYSRAAFFLRDPATNLFRVRASFGTPAMKFSFPSTYVPDLVHAALSHATDLHIADVTAEKVAAKLPAWFARELPRTRSFLLMPLVIKDKPIGLFFADRELADAHGLSADELNLLRSLRNQVVLALRSR
jgi:HD-like signal output (HDOD) protein